MDHSASLHATASRGRTTLLVVLAILGLAVALLVPRWSPATSASSTSTTSATTMAVAVATAPPEVPGAAGPIGRQAAVGTADGVVPEGAEVSVFDDEVPAVGNLAPDLLDALRRSATQAASEGIAMRVNSGWRSPAYQRQLLREAEVDHGSAQEAARWVATPETSAHVRGTTVDIGPYDAAAWLGRHGAGHGLCQIYVNEPWHFELRPDAIGQGCPPRYVDPTVDPRMHQA